MNKSTPIAQLPATPSQNTFINDQQRQYITQAQQAISNTSLPQNTQMSSDIANDDDMVVQDILNQINASAGSDSAPSVQNTPPANINAPLQQLLIQPQGNVQSAPSLGQQPSSMQMGTNPLFLQQPQYQIPQMEFSSPNMFQSITSVPQEGMDYKSYILQMAGDLKLAGLVFAVVVLAHFVPIENYISKYIAVDKIPYHQVILRAIMAALLVIVIKKMLKI